MVVLALAVASAAPGRPARAETAVEENPLFGSWSVVSAEEDGVEDREPEEEALIFSDQKLTLKLAAEEGGAAPPFGSEITYSFDASAQPAELDLRLEFREGPQARTVTVLAIFVVERDSLTICLSQPGKPRPDAVKTVKNDGRRLLVLKKRQP